MTAFGRHRAAIDNAALPAGRWPLGLGGNRVGWVRPDLARTLAGLPGFVLAADAVEAASPEALPQAARALADRGMLPFRGEAFDVRAGEDGPVLTTLDRGALPAFGVLAHGVHVNGLVRRADGLHLWVAKRAADKAVDPGKLDHIAAGGVPAGLTPRQTLVKEAHEEAAIPEALAREAKLVGHVRYVMDRPEGLRRDVLHCYDLELPEDFVPHPNDGEIEHFALWPVRRAWDAVRDTELFKFNVNLVLIDLFQRLGMPT